MPKHNQEKQYSTRIHFPLVVSIIALSAALICFVRWQNTSSLWQIVLVTLSALVFIILSRPVIEGRRVLIRKDKITLYCRPFRPKTFKIADTLYQIVMRDDAVRSFRFSVNEKPVQISPLTFTDGEEMSDRIMAIMKKKKIKVGYGSV
ncbi:MAG: hypothetical protein U9N60_05990 [Thermodesulfobacteriota bacterium]|nr:hypothetical protein [Thermodesulfobacteriota bacterium]